MELGSSPPCPRLAAVRRNPPRKGRASSSNTAVDRSVDVPETRLKEIQSFSLQDLDESTARPSILPPPETTEASQSIRVFLRLRPSHHRSRINGGANRMKSKLRTPEKNEKNSIADKNSETCLIVNDSNSVTLLAPIVSKRSQKESFEGFTHVFPENSAQEDVYRIVMHPLVQDFILGKSGLLAAMGPSGSGKTHTIFGTPKDPGLLPRALRQIFSLEHDIDASKRPRLYYLSMFEICSERGKREKIIDLTTNRSDSRAQHSSIKGLQEVKISNFMEAECALARGMLKRATAETNANDQSSRSQCVINIRNTSQEDGRAANFLPSDAVLTIVDLAGAERERITGNQGVRLSESNFINNTSMVVGLCLKSLLEHQKNPKKPLQKHFQSSLLTQYLREYFEGKKRMTLFITINPWKEDYLHTLLLLRQAAPYMKIRYDNVEEIPEKCNQKRPVSTLFRVEKLKKQKYADKVTSVKASSSEHLIPAKEKNHSEHVKSLISSQLPTVTTVPENSQPSAEYQTEFRRIRRCAQVMRDLSRALWNVLKEYKQKLKISEKEALTLRKSLMEELDRVRELEEELQELKSSSLQKKQVEAYSSPMFDACVTICETSSLQRVHENCLDIVQENPSEFDGLKIEECLGVIVSDGLVGKSSEASNSTSDVVTGSPKLLSNTTSCCPETLAIDCSPLLNVEANEIQQSEEVLAILETSVKGSAGCVDAIEVTEVKMDSEEDHLPKHSQMERPKRRLLPLSSMLLKDISNLVADDEVLKGKGKMGVDGGKSHGNVLLAQLLTRKS